MCVLCVSFGSKVRTRTYGCVSMGSAMLFILSSRFLLYSAGSGVNRMQAGFFQAKTLCRYGCIIFSGCTRTLCVAVMVMSSA